MKTHHLLAIILTILVPACSSPRYSIDHRESTAVIQPDPHALLRGMSDKLAGAKRFSFSAQRQIDRKIAKTAHQPAKGTVDITVQRPDKLAAVSTSADDIRHIYLDGRNLSMLDARENLYATVPMRGSIDDVHTRLVTEYGFAPPLAEFIVSDPYKEILHRTRNITYAGIGTAHSAAGGAVKCHRLALSGSLVDAELWLAVDDLLPRRLTATLADGSKRKALDIAFSDWNLTAPATGFTLSPPAGAQKIPMHTTAQAHTSN